MEADKRPPSSHGDLGPMSIEISNNPVFEWMSNAADSLNKLLASEEKDKEEEKEKEDGDGPRRSGSSRGDRDPGDGRGAAVGTAAAAASGMSRDDDEDRHAGNGEQTGQRGGSRAGQGRSEDEFMVLTRKLIEVRNILKTIDHDDTLHLPSIVVIGSQSSGKSSVLESIVGQEFLPK